MMRNATNELVTELVAIAFTWEQAGWLVENNPEYAKKLARNDVTDSEIEEAEAYLAMNGMPHEYAEKTETKLYVEFENGNSDTFVGFDEYHALCKAVAYAADNDTSISYHTELD